MGRVLGLLVLIASTRAGADSWTAADTALQLTAATVTLGDWSQTITIAREPLLIVETGPGTIGPGYPRTETNPILGAHPSAERVDVYFASVIALHAGIAYLLPHPWRTIWQIALIGLEGECVLHNHAVGVQFSF